MLFDVYLTVDLDYWTIPCKSIESQRRSMDRLLRRVKELRRPTLVAATHDAALDHIGKRKYKQVINVDFHDDLEAESAVQKRWVRPGPTEADWATYVKRRSEMMYEWRYPDLGFF